MTVASPPEDTTDVSAPRSPYVGLVPYDEADAAFFFGRSTEAAVIAANLRAARLTIVYGPSGVGKSSLLNAGVVHRLRSLARSAAVEDDDDEDEPASFAVCTYTSWNDDPVAGLTAAARVALEEAAGHPLPAPGETLAATLQVWTQWAGRLLLVLDQFEEYFQYQPDESAGELSGFAAELVGIVNDPALQVHVLLSLREDALARLDCFKGRVPALFSNYLRVDHLDLDAAREAVEGPVDAWNRTLPHGAEQYVVEPELTDLVIAAAAAGGLTLVAGDDTRAVGAASRDRVEAPFLQLVLERLWRAAVADGDHALTLARLEALGGAVRIVQNHLLDALARLSSGEQDAASDCFRFLVSSSGTKIACPAPDLAEWTQRPQPEVAVVLDKLCTGDSGRILRAVAPTTEGGNTRYELFHDILAEPILAWRRGHEAERRRRIARRRLIRIGGAATALVVFFGGLAAYGIRQAANATRAKNAANSLLIASDAGAQLKSHPDLALVLALAAYRKSPTVAAESSVIAALEAIRGSGVAGLVPRGQQGLTSVAFSPDGTTLAAGGRDGTVALWGTTSHRRAATLSSDDHSPVLSVAFSRHGRELAAGAADGTTRLWNVSTRTPVGRPLGPPPAGQPHSVTAVAFSPDGRTLATLATGTTEQQVSVGHGHCTVTVHKGHASELCVGPAEATAIVPIGSVTVWSLATHTPLGRLRAPRGGHVAGFSFSPDGHVLATAEGQHGTVGIWAVGRRLKLERRVRSHVGAVDAVAFAPNGRALAAGGAGGLALLDGTTGAGPVHLLGAHGGTITALAFGPGGDELAAAEGPAGNVVLWSTKRSSRLAALRGNQGSVNSIALSPDGRTLAAAAGDGAVLLWNTQDRTPALGKPLAGSDGGYVVAFSPDGRTLATGTNGEDGKVALWSASTGARLRLLHAGALGSITNLAFSPDGRTLAASGDSSVAAVWDLRTGRKRVLHEQDVFCFAFSPDGRTLATCGDNGVQLWSTATGKKDGGVCCGFSIASVAFSPDGKTIAVAGTDDVRLWNADTHAPLGAALPIAPGEINDVAYSPDGRTLAVAGFNGIVLWDVATHSLLGPNLHGGQGTVYQVSFSHDGRTLAAAADNGIFLWDVRTRTLLGRPLAVSDFSVAFSPDEPTFATAGYGPVQLWSGILWKSTAALEQQVCGLLWGSVDKAAWSQAAPGLAYERPCPA